MHPTLPKPAVAVIAVGLSLISATPWAAGAHEHGAVRLDVAMEGRTLSVAMAAPLDNLLGFERAPRTAAERQAADGLLQRLRQASGLALFAADAAAQCRLVLADVHAPALESPPAAARGDRHRDRHDHDHDHDDAKHGDAEGHADLDATYTFDCARPDALRQLEVGLFKAFSRIRRIDVQVVGPKGQSKVTLKRPAQQVHLQR